jgi:predicted  nucleic acid-binding Zn-ribbon protein
VKDLLEGLVSLQVIDTRLQELEEKRGDLPEIVKRKRQQLAREETQLNEFSDELKEILSNLTRTDGSLSDARAKLEKYEQQLFEVKNNREYDAMTSEIENKKLEIKRLEEDRTALLNRQEGLEGKVEELEAKVDTLSAEFADKRKELDEKLKITEKEENDLNSKRKKVSAKVKGALLKKYDRIRQAKSGLAVVPIIRSACGGCSTILPPQRLIDIRRQDDMYICESCGRILYWQEEPDSK